MAEVIIDSNILLDVMTEDAEWFAFSAGILEEYAEDHTLVINPIIYAEVSIGFDRIEDLDAALPSDKFLRRPIPTEAAFLAGKCFVKYRRRSGTKRSTLPDFFVGAHAAVEKMPLITRDVARYRSYFPTLKIIAPES
ncbi:MAG: type II toxin-antitoxin system VapC family toxin [Planctomycetota bacterium]|nr:type II toxin-antitoxin system VapC family toxin [Planctomycetota bacterium]